MVSFWFEESGVVLRHMIGLDNMMWADSPSRRQSELKYDPEMPDGVPRGAATPPQTNATRLRHRARPLQLA
jgi:hypothetical protein